MMQGGFSIREYASRMRSISVINCWPFDEPSSEETVKSWLPSITVKKFTWWLDELEYIHSESVKISEKRKEKKQKKGESSSRNEDQYNMEESEIDAKEGVGVVKAKPLKGKMKTQKKRSIVEIFAVAPPVERVMSEAEEDDDDDDDDDDDSIEEEDAKKKMKKNTGVILRKALRVVKKIKKKKSEMGESLPNKVFQENVFKFKPRAQAKTTGDPSSSYSKEFDHNVHDYVPLLKRKQSFQHLDAYKRTTPCEAFKPVEENEHPGLPVRGILKNHGESFPLDHSAKYILQESVRTSDCTTRKANKHVTFSKKDDILRLSRKPSPSVEYREFHKVSPIVESSGSEGVSIGIGKEVENLTTCICDSTAFSMQNNEHSRWSEASDRSSLHYVNQDWSTDSLRDARHNPNVFASEYVSTPLDGYYNNPNSKVIRNSSNSICRRLTKDFETPCPIAPPTCFDNCLSTEKSKYISIESTALNSTHPYPFPTCPHLSPKELMNTFCSLPDGRRGINGINEDFIGLPLNSQGELVTLNSSVEREVHEMTSSSIGSERRSFDCRSSSLDQLNLFPIESYAKENPVAVIPSRLGITDPQNERETNLIMDFLETNYHPSHDSGSIVFKGDNHVHQSLENEKIQSTMRLMGKEFKIGGMSVQGFESGHIWKDKQIIDQNEQSLRKLRETLYYPSEITTNQRSESKYAVPHLDCQSSSMYPSVFIARKIDPVQRLHPTLTQDTLSEVYNSNEALLSEPFANGFESHLFTLDLPTPRAAHQEAGPNINPSAMQLKNNQNLPHSISAIRFPFVHPDLDGNAVYSWSRRPSVNRGPLVFDTPRKATQVGNSQYCSLGSNHPYLKPTGLDHGTDSSVYLKPDEPRMFFPFSSGSAPQTSVTQSSLAPMPYYPGGIFMQTRHGNPKKFKERIKSRIGSRVLDNGNKLKGQLSAISTVPFKPFKVPTVGSHEQIQCPITKPTNKSKPLMCGKYEADNDEWIISPWADSNADGARTGHVKLTSGANHKSSLPTDEDIPLSPSAFRFSESDNSMNIYRFSGKGHVFEL